MSLVAASVARRRANEKNVQERMVFIKEECNATSVARWEERTTNRIAKQNIQNRIKQLAQFEESSLNQRRDALDKLYQNDVSKWEAQFAELQNVSTDERLQKIRLQAQSLRKKREEENQVYVNECYKRQWRDGCDELRTLKSKAITEKVMNDRANNAHSNELVQHLSEGLGHERSNGLKNSQTLNAVTTEETNNDRRNRETKAALDIQVELLHNRNQLEREKKMSEEMQKIELWKKEDEIAKKKKLQQIQTTRQIGEDIQRANERRQANREMDQVNQRKQDLVLLQVALKKEKKEIELEEMRKYEGKEAAKEHLFLLREQMIQDKEEKETVEAIRKIEMDRILKKSDNLIHVRDLEKKNLLADVNATRLLQIREKERRYEKETYESKKQVSITLSELREQDCEELEKASLRKQATIENMLANKIAMKEKTHQKAKEKEEELEFHRQIIKQEKEHIQRIKCEATKFT